METYSAVKLLHVTVALLSIAGFFYRWALMKGGKDLKADPVTSILPHIIDTVLLGSAVGLIVLGPFDLMNEHWLLAKILFVIAYIVFGMQALKKDREPEARQKAFTGATICIVLIVSLAVEHLIRVNNGNILANGAEKATVVEEFDHGNSAEDNAEVDDSAEEDPDA